jgi:anti-sigma factor RsiW
MTLTCRKVAELLIDYADGTLADDQRDLLQRHLCGCVPCAIYMHTYSTTIRVTQELPDVPIPTEFASRLMAVLKASCPEGEQKQ